MEKFIEFVRSAKGHDWFEPVPASAGDARRLDLCMMAASVRDYFHVTELGRVVSRAMAAGYAVRFLSDPDKPVRRKSSGAKEGLGRYADGRDNPEDFA